MADRPPSRAKSSSGRETSFGRETSGFKGWIPCRFHEGKNPGGSIKTSEGFKNVLNNHEVRPKEGWNGAPPYPTGELAATHHASEAYREGWERIWGPSANPQSGS